MTALVDAVIAITLVEALALIVVRRATGRGPALRDVGLNLLSGLCLMLAIAGLLRGADGAWLVACLTAAGAAHGGDLWLRAARTGRRANPLQQMDRPDAPRRFALPTHPPATGTTP